MADVFLSYAKEDRPTAEVVTQALEAEGWSVFWDPEIPIGDTWAESLERQLLASGCILVLWSKASLPSKWVSKEARFGEERGILVPALIQDVKPPFEFEHIQAADLIGWEGDQSDAGFRALLGIVEVTVSGTRATENPVDPDRRVAISYDYDPNGSAEGRELPFTVGVLADLAGEYGFPLERRFIEIDSNNFDKVLSGIRPKLLFTVDNKLEPDAGEKLGIELVFKRLEDFTPEGILLQVDPLRSLLEHRRNLLTSGGLSPDSSSPEPEGLGEELDGAAHPVPAEGPANTTDETIRQIDVLLSGQLGEVMRSPKLRRLESSWRGLHHLVTQTDTDPLLKIRILPISKEELARDTTSGRAEISLDRSGLFQMVFRDELGQFGGRPFGILIGDYSFGREGPDVKLLSRISQIAAAAQAPFIAAADPGMFGLEAFSELSAVEGLQTAFAAREYAQWRAYRRTQDSSYVVLTLPRMLLREPYRGNGPSMEDFGFSEVLQGESQSRGLWGTAAWGLASCVARAFARYHWCVRIQGANSGGLVEGVPEFSGQAADGEAVTVGPTEVPISGGLEEELVRLGFAPMVRQADGQAAVFPRIQSTHSTEEPGSQGVPDIDSKPMRSARLPFLLAVSRFSHHLRALLRNLIGSFSTPDELSQLLNQWLAGYVAQDATSAPLSEGRIEVVEDPRRPGSHAAVMSLRPWLQMDTAESDLEPDTVELARIVIGLR